MIYKHITFIVFSESDNGVWLSCAMCRHLEWDHDEHSVVLKSTHCKPQHNSQLDESPLMALAVLSVWPLQFTGLIEVYKKVHL